MKLRRIVLVTVGLLFFALQVDAAKSKPLAKEIPVTSKSRKAVEAFKQGRDLQDNVRFAEAEAKFREAVALDPNFARAHASLGQVTPGSEGEKHLQQAVALSARNPETERMVIEAMLADRRGDFKRSLELRRKLVAMAPNDWHEQLALGNQLAGQREWAAAIPYLKRATELNPAAGSAYNNLGYAYLLQGQNDQAIEAFRQYAAARPAEPNPPDSLGEALTRAGRYDEAERAYMDALKNEPSFFSAWQGIAQSRFLNRKWGEGAQALARAEETAIRPQDKSFIKGEHAWMQFARGNVADALKEFDAIEKYDEANGLTAGYAAAPIARATILNGVNRPFDALEQASIARERARAANVSGASQRFLGNLALRAQLESQVALGRLGDARRTLAELQQLANDAPSVPDFRGSVHFGLGMLAMAEGDAKSAVSHFAQCVPDDTGCMWNRMRAEAMAGDAAAAEATRNRIRTSNLRNAVDLHVVEKVKG